MLLASALGFLSFSSFAQEEELKPFKVDVSLGYASPGGGKGAKGGLLFAVEPKYAVLPNLAVGLRLETAIMARATGMNSTSGDAEVEVKAAASYVATGDYYFTNNYSFRPFAGAGAGLFGVAAATATTTSTTDEGSVGSSTKFGGLVRAGAEMRHFRVGIEYNLIGASTYNAVDANGATSKYEVKNSYLGVKLGICIGGGPR